MIRQTLKAFAWFVPTLVGGLCFVVVFFYDYDPSYYNPLTLRVSDFFEVEYVDFVLKCAYVSIICTMLNVVGWGVNTLLIKHAPLRRYEISLFIIGGLLALSGIFALVVYPSVVSYTWMAIGFVVAAIGWGRLQFYDPPIGLWWKNA